MNPEIKIDLDVKGEMSKAVMSFSGEAPYQVTEHCKLDQLDVFFEKIEENLFGSKYQIMLLCPYCLKSRTIKLF